MEALIALVLIVLFLLLLVQSRSNHAKIDESLKLTRDIHREVVKTSYSTGKVVDKHVGINKAEGEKLRETVKKTDSK